MLLSSVIVPFPDLLAKAYLAKTITAFGKTFVSYLSKLRRDSVGADFQSVRKLTNYVCDAPPVSRLSVFRDGS